MIIFPFFLIGLFHKSYDLPASIPSSDIPIDFNENPKLIAHISDIHLDYFTPSRAENFQKSINLSKQLGATTILFTGDITNNFGCLEENVMAYGNQFKPDYDEYFNVLDKFNFSDTPLIDIPGNHDEYGVYNYTKSNHYFINYSHYFNTEKMPEVEKFWAGSFVYNDITYIYANPYEFPIPHAKLGFWINAGKRLLDLIEAELNRPFNTTHRILLTHFPVHLWNDRYKSSSKKSFRQMVAEANLSLVLTGHLHPKTTTFKHHQQILEAVAPDLMSHKKFGIIVNDNNVLSYHTIDLDNPPEYLIISPIPMNQIHKNTNYKTQVPVRILVFSDKEKRIYLETYGEVLNRKKITDGIWLYYGQLDLIQGKKTISISGDINENIEYYIDSNPPALEKELIYGYPNLISTILAIFWIGIIFNIFFLLPMPKCQCTKVYADWIDGSSGSARISDILWNTIFGFLLIKIRLSRAPFIHRLHLIFLSLCPLFIPIFFMSVDGHSGAVFFWGYVIHGIYHYDIYGIIFIAIYYAISMILMIMAVAEFSYKITLFNRIIGSILLLVMLAVSLFMTFNLGILTSGLAGALTSPIYVLIPLEATLVFGIWGICRKSSYDELL